MEMVAPGQNCHDTFVNTVCALACVSVFVCTWEALELSKRPQCLCSDSVFAVGHSIFYERGVGGGPGH